MRDMEKTKEQLGAELEALRRRVSELEKSTAERGKAEEKKGLIDEFYRNMVELSPDGILAVDTKGVIISCNTAVTRMLDYSRDEMVGKHFTKLGAIRLKDIPKHVKLFRSALENKVTKPLELTFKRKDGTLVVCEVSFSLLKVGNKSILQSTSRDVTEHKRMEEALRLHVEITANMSEGVYLVRADNGVITYTNPKFEELFGYSPSEIVGKHISIVNAPTEKSPEETAKEVMEFIAETGGWRGEIQNIKKDGTPFWCYASVSVFDHPEFGKVLVAVHSDITERKQAEEELRKHQGHLEELVKERTQEIQQTVAELERSNAELERFAYVASHDLQEPLRMVANYTELLARRYKDKLDADGHDFIGYAVDGAKRMQELINDLLTYSRIGTRGKPFEPTDCTAVFDAAVANLEVATRDNNAEVSHDPLPTVMADKGQLLQLFQNLIDNAIKFHGEEPARVHVSTEQKGDEWVFSVRDNGIGIDQQYFERIFVVFERLHGKECPGTGIGLSIAKKIVERHCGRIWIESQPGRGSIVRFTIPSKGGKQS